MGRQNETVNVTTFTLPKAMNEQTFTLNVLNDKSYQLVSDGVLAFGASRQGVGTRWRDDAG